MDNTSAETPDPAKGLFLIYQAEEYELVLEATVKKYLTRQAIIQQAVGQLPWRHNLVLLSKLKDQELRMPYAQCAVEHGWSRSVLEMQIETKRIEREGKAVANFTGCLPAVDTDLARQSFKASYLFDFLHNWQ